MSNRYGDLREGYLDSFVAAQQEVTRLLDALELILREAVTLADAQQIAREALFDA